MPSGIEWMMTCAPRKSSTLSEGCLGGSRGFLRMVFGTTGFANALNLMYGKQRRNVIFFSMGERRSGLETKDDIESISWTNMQILSNSCYVCWVFSKISYTSRLRHRTDVHMGMTSRSNMKLHWERRKKERRVSHNEIRISSNDTSMRSQLSSISRTSKGLKLEPSIDGNLICSTFERVHFAQI